jgi:gas vesicle protein
MNKARRSFLTGFVPGAAIAATALLTAETQQSSPTHPPFPPTDPNKQQSQQQVPPDVPKPTELTPAERKAILARDQKEIKKEVDALLSLAQDLKSQTDKMDSTAILSVGFVQKTEEIEKLARKIRNLARG